MFVYPLGTFLTENTNSGVRSSRRVTLSRFPPSKPVPIVESLAMADTTRLEAMAAQLYSEMVQGLVLDGVFAAHKEIERARQSCSVCGSQSVAPF